MSVSTFNYLGAASSAHGVLRQFGAAATLSRMPSGTYDPATGANTVAAAVVTNCTAVVLPIKDEWVSGQLVRTTQKRALIAAPSVTEPKVGDVLAWQGSNMRIVDVKTLAPAGVAVLYTATVEA